MAVVSFADRIKVSTATTGAGTITLGAAFGGFRTFAAAVTAGDLVDGATVAYAIEDAGGAWETGIGTFSNSASTLTRTLRRSSSGSLLNLSGAALIYLVPGTADLYGDLPLGVYSETNSGASSVGGGTTTLDFSADTTFGPLTLTGNQTIALSNATLSGRTRSAVLFIIAGSYTVTWPSGWKWVVGSAPTLSTSGTDAVFIIVVNGVVYASISKGYA